MKHLLRAAAAGLFALAAAPIFALSGSGDSAVGSLDTVAPPAGPTGITVQPIDEDTSLILRITHPVTVVTGHRLFVEITPALASPARAPQPSDYRAVRGLSAPSFPALAATNTNYTFNGIRFPLTDGARFGVRATIISPLGIPSTTFEATRLQVFV